MIALSVQSLSGGSVNTLSEIGPKIADLRAQLEHRLEPLQEVRLFHGSREILDDQPVEVVLQAVTTKSSAKALKVVEEFVVMSLPTTTAGHLLNSAFSVLDEMNDLTIDQCERLWHVLDEVFAVSRWGCRTEVQHFHLLLGTVFGRTCCNPISWIPQLDRLLLDNSASSAMPLAAMVEILKRCEVPQKTAEKLILLAEYWLGDSWEIHYLEQDIVIRLECHSISVLGFLGHPNDLLILEEIAEDTHGRSKDIRTQALEAAALLRKRFEVSREVALDLATELSELAPNVQTQFPQEHVVEPAGNIENGSTQQSLEQVLSESETEALQHHEVLVQEAFLESLIGFGEVASSSITIAILHYSQAKRWFWDALLTGDDLKEERDRMAEAGFSPKLNSGAKIFLAPDLYTTVVQHLEETGWDLKTSHIVVSKDLEAKVRNVVETARANARKDERGTCKVGVQELSIQPQDDTASQASAAPSENNPCLIKHTFVHIPLPSSMRSASSYHPPTV